MAPLGWRKTPGRAQGGCQPHTGRRHLEAGSRVGAGGAAPAHVRVTPGVRGGTRAGGTGLASWVLAVAGQTPLQVPGLPPLCAMPAPSSSSSAPRSHPALAAAPVRCQHMETITGGVRWAGGPPSNAWPEAGRCKQRPPILRLRGLGVWPWGQTLLPGLLQPSSRPPYAALVCVCVKTRSGTRVGVQQRTLSWPPMPDPSPGTQRAPKPAPSSRNRGQILGSPWAPLQALPRGHRPCPVPCPGPVPPASTLSLGLESEAGAVFVGADLQGFFLRPPGAGRSFQRPRRWCPPGSVPHLAWGPQPAPCRRRATVQAAGRASPAVQARGTALEPTVVLCPWRVMRGGRGSPAGATGSWLQDLGFCRDTGKEQDAAGLGSGTGAAPQPRPPSLAGRHPGSIPRDPILHPPLLAQLLCTPTLQPLAPAPASPADSRPLAPSAGERAPCPPCLSATWHPPHSLGRVLRWTAAARKSCFSGVSLP